MPCVVLAVSLQQEKGGDECEEFDTRGIYPALYCVLRIKSLFEVQKVNTFGDVNPDVFFVGCPQFASYEMGKPVSSRHLIDWARRG